MAISILNYYEQSDGKNLMIMEDSSVGGGSMLPSESVPMNPSNFAISQNLGVPADGSIVVSKTLDKTGESKIMTRVFSGGEWKGATEGGGEIKTGYINITKDNKCDIDEAIAAIEENDMILVDSGTYKALIVGVYISFPVLYCVIPATKGDDEVMISSFSEIFLTESGTSIISEDKTAKFFDLLLTKNVYPIYTLYTRMP